MGKRLFLLFVLCASMVGAAFAQKQVVGRVIEQATGEPVIGASVLVQGTTVGATTDMNGDFVIGSVPDGAKVLRVSFVGLKEAYVSIKPKMRIFMEPSATSLDDVLVVAYGTQKKVAYTGAASEIKAEDISNHQYTSATQALVGTMAGVQTLQTSGDPGEAPTVRIRGISSLNGDLSPLYVVDGMPYDGDLTAINPHDIESMTVLKDAVGSALYGARGANGVVMITTKRGKAGDAKITFDAKWGSVSREIGNYDVMTNPAQYLETEYAGIYNTLMASGKYTAAQAHAQSNTDMQDILAYKVYTVPEGQFLIGTNGKLNPNATLGYSDGQYYYTPDNWADETFRNGLRQEYNLSISGADDRLNYYVSGGYLNDEGVIHGSGYERFSTRANLEYQVKPWLRVGSNVSYSRANYNFQNEQDSSNSTGNAWGVAYYMAPIYPMYVRNADGSVKWDALYGHPVYDYGTKASTNFIRPYSALANPASAFLYDSNENRADIFNANWFAKADLTHGFSATVRIGLHADNTLLETISNPIYGQSAAYGGEVSNTHSRITALDHQYVLSYQNTFGDHTVAASAGFDGYRYRSSNFWGNGQNMYRPFDNTLYNVIDQKNVGGSKSEYSTAGFFFTGNYNFQQRFFANVGLRRDGTSVFAKGNRWGTFGSFGLGWDMKKEEWLKDVGAVDLLKLRASYGKVGNDNHGQSLYAYADRYRVTGADGTFSDGTLVYKGNADLQWEKTSSYNVGVDFSLFKNRLSGSFEFFSRVTDNLLDYKKVAISNGYSTIPVNMGKIRNRGVELEASYAIVRNRDMEWSVNLNLTHYSNKILKLSDDYENGQYTTGMRIYREGGSIYNLYLVKWAGVDPETGIAQYWTKETAADADGNETTSWVKTDDWQAAYDTSREETGTILPDVYGGFGTSFAWKGFDFSIQASYQLGGDIFDYGYQDFMSTGSSSTKGTTFHKDLLKAWTKDNPNTGVPRFVTTDLYATSMSTRFVTSSDYLSIDNVTLGYTLPKTLTLPIGIDAIRVYASAENVAIFSARKGLDPRRGFASTDGATYSARRMVSGGIKLTF